MRRLHAPPGAMGMSPNPSTRERSRVWFAAISIRTGLHALTSPDTASLGRDLNSAQVIFQLLEQVIEFRCGLVRRSLLNRNAKAGQIGKTVRVAGGLHLVPEDLCTFIVACDQ